MTMVTR